MTRHKVLILHALRPSSRQTTIDHLLAFREHLPDADVQYLHFAQPLPVGIMRDIEPDVLIVNYDYLNYRFTPLWPYIRDRHRDIAQRARHVVAIPQDDFWAYRLLDKWCLFWNVSRVLTPLDKDLHVLYPKTIDRAEFRTVLTGYAPKSADLSPPLESRPVDLGQRVRAMAPSLGTYAQEKARQASEFSECARRAGFVVDVSTRVTDSIIGADWSKFLRRCKFTIGMKGGASIADPFGLLFSRAEARRHRRNTEHLSANSLRFLRQKDGKYLFSAISPRLFESAAAGTCQILRPDNYLDVLEPWRHYLPLDKNHSNVDEVLNAMRDLDSCQQIAENARRILIDSGMFGYRSLVETASRGLFDGTPSGNEHSWSVLVSHLRRASQLCTPEMQHLHEAALHLIHETLNGPDANMTSAQTWIRNQIEQFGLSEWFLEQRQLAKSDPLAWRSPWIWRALQ